MERNEPILKVRNIKKETSGGLPVLTSGSREMI
jgi:hypothetical protein